MTLLHVPINQVDEARLPALITARAAGSRTIYCKPQDLRQRPTLTTQSFWPTRRPRGGGRLTSQRLIEKLGLKERAS
jgi:hypothetical protein